MESRIAGAGLPDVKPVAGQAGRINVSMEALALVLRMLNLQVAKGNLPSDLVSQVHPGQTHSKDCCPGVLVHCLMSPEPWRN